jgi:hypothetical protein
MKNTIIIAVVALFLSNCSKTNEVRIVNSASESIYFNFRAEVYPLASGQQILLEDIPNGTYDYNTTFGLPAGITKMEAQGDASGGTLSFSYGQTAFYLLYSSVTDSSKYMVYVNKTSSDNKNNVTEP